MDPFQLFVVAAFILLLVLITARILVKPLRLLVKIIFNSFVGLLMLLVFNFIGGLLGFTIPVNIVTVLLAGFLGIPGLILLIVVQIIGI
ncbi:MAG: pro-sigmaK processing inhibitor BofA family protein [Bacillota bacterium]|jgi:inhibitor of the pro-sigma K processing machinery